MHAKLRPTGQIDTMKWGIPVLELAEAANGLAEKGNCDPVALVATTLLAAIADDPNRLNNAVRAFNLFGFTFRRHEPKRHDTDIEESAA